VKPPLLGYNKRVRKNYMIKKLLITSIVLATVATAQAHPTYAYRQPTRVYYTQPPVMYVPRVVQYYPAPSITFGVGGGSSRVYFTVPLR
jgi:hypothetical protein